MTTPLYRGFSSKKEKNVIDTRLTNIELVKQDLLNHFNTRIGERVARPGFGSIIHDLLFDLADDRTESLVLADANRIFDSDPRVVPIQVDVELSRDTGTIKLNAKLRFVEFNMDDNFIAIFSTRL